MGFSGFKKSAVMGIEWIDGKGELRFLLDPAEMKAHKRLKPPAPAAPPGEPEGE